MVKWSPTKARFGAEPTATASAKFREMREKDEKVQLAKNVLSGIAAAAITALFFGRVIRKRNIAFTEQARMLDYHKGSQKVLSEIIDGWGVSPKSGIELYRQDFPTMRDYQDNLIFRQQERALAEEAERLGIEVPTRPAGHLPGEELYSFVEYSRDPVVWGEQPVMEHRIPTIVSPVFPQHDVDRYTYIPPTPRTPKGY